MRQLDSTSSTMCILTSGRNQHPCSYFSIAVRMGGKELRSNRNFNKKAWMIVSVPASCTWCLSSCVSVLPLLSSFSRQQQTSHTCYHHRRLSFLLVCVPLGGLNGAPLFWHLFPSYYPFLLLPPRRLNEQKMSYLLGIRALLTIELEGPSKAQIFLSYSSLESSTFCHIRALSRCYLRSSMLVLHRSLTSIHPPTSQSDSHVLSFFDHVRKLFALLPFVIVCFFCGLLIKDNS